MMGRVHCYGLTQCCDAHSSQHTAQPVVLLIPARAKLRQRGRAYLACCRPLRSSVEEAGACLSEAGCWLAAAAAAAAVGVLGCCSKVGLGPQVIDCCCLGRYCLRSESSHSPQQTPRPAAAAPARQQLSQRDLLVEMGADPPWAAWLRNM